MKLDPDLIHYLTKEHFRVLTAVEMGMKNHEFVPVPLIESLAALKRSNTFKLLQFCLKHKLVMHVNKAYDGYALTYMGYDYLALKAFMKRGHVKSIGIKIGVGKESDIYLCETPEGEIAVLKFARLGRTSFRTVKDNRDYLKGRSAQSWLYLSRIASLKEFAFMKALYGKQFPTPVPIDSNRHAIVMSYIRAYPMSQIKELQNPTKVYEQLMDQIIRLAEYGLVHGDFNEFNLLISEEEQITIIDFPQMTSTSHPNAEFYFERDVKCIQEFFFKRFGLIFEGMPRLEKDIEKKEDLDKEIKASGFIKEELGEDTSAFDTIHEHFLNKENNEEEQEENEEEKQEDEKSQENENSSEEGSGSESSEEDEQNEQKEEVQNDNADPNNTDPNNTQTNQQLKTKKKFVVNQDYVKERVKKQFWNKEKKKQAKRNKNKDKKTMKTNETIKDYFVE